MNQGLRDTLRDRFRTASKFDAFVLDHFSGVFREFVSGTTRTERENLLASHVSEDRIRAAMGGSETA